MGWVQEVVRDFLAEARRRHRAALEAGRPAPSVITSIDDLVKYVQIGQFLSGQLPEKTTEDDGTEEWIKQDKTAGKLLAEVWRRKMDFLNRRKGIVEPVAEPQVTPEEDGVLGREDNGNGVPEGDTA